MGYITDARMRASEKDLPVLIIISFGKISGENIQGGNNLRGNQFING